MIDQDNIAGILDATAVRRAERRRFLQVAGSGAAAAGGLSLLAACGGGSSNSTPTPTPTPTPTATGTASNLDADILNFALNLEYLEAQFYSYAATGAGLPGTSLGGTGAAGTVTGGRQVNFTDPVIAAYAREIARDERAHVDFLRSQLGTSAVAMPAINIDGGTTGAFTAAARAAGVIGSSDTFDPYGSDEAFLYGAFIFEDVGVTAYKGAAPLITNATYLTAAAGILAAEAYHAGLIRSALYAKGLSATPLKISDARDSLDGSSDLDQGITGTDASIANIVPADSNAVAYSRTTGQVLNIVYLSKAAVSAGGFFPAGLNGNLKTSAASG